MKAILVTSIGSLLFCLATSAVAQPTATPQAALAPTPAAASAVAPKAADATAHVLQNGRPLQLVHLRSDGNLMGCVGKPDPSGTRYAVRVRLAFVQNGQIIQSTRTDEWGCFQVGGLRPGVYTVLAAGQNGVGIFAVRVEPFVEKAPAQQTNASRAKVQFASARNLADNNADNSEANSLELNVVPSGDAQVFTQMLTEEGLMPAGGAPGAVTPGFAPGMGAMGGGGGAGGGGLGLGGLLGAAGLAAGLGGMGGQGGGGQPPASLSVPAP